MTQCFFVSDLHGKMSRYDRLAERIASEKPSVVFMGGDLLPHSLHGGPGKMGAEEFASDYLPRKFRKLKEKLGEDYPDVLLILGNDDPRYLESFFMQHEEEDLWKYIHNKTIFIHNYSITGYSMVPPTPFQLKDWELYDVSAFTDPGCTGPSEGYRTMKPTVDVEHITIQKELQRLSAEMDVSRSVWLFHSPPYQSKLDRASLDGMMVEHVPLDVHIGSIAIQRFIRDRQPHLTLHGHVHESTRLTGAWCEMTGSTCSVNAAHDGPELALVRFTLENPNNATRELLG